MKRILIVIILPFVLSFVLRAEDGPQEINASPEDEKVLVNGDTVSIVLKQRNFGRYDRGLFNYLFIPKGQWAFGLTANYGSFDAEDVQLLSVLKNFDFTGKRYSIKPSISYFFAHNQSIGIKLNYTRATADLGGMSLDIDDDMSFTLSDVSYYSQSYSASLTYRNYIGLSRDKRFAVFNDVDLMFGSGSSRFKRYYNEELRDTRTNSIEVGLNFSPGLCVFIQEHVSFGVSFGVFGLSIHKDSQSTNGVDEGSRVSSGANFKFNIFNINFGISVHI